MAYEEKIIDGVMHWRDLPTYDWKTGEQTQSKLLASDMTLRDYFAGQAMNGMFAFPGRQPDTEPGHAAWSYMMADAMLEARKKQDPKALNE